MTNEKQCPAKGLVVPQNSIFFSNIFIDYLSQMFEGLPGPWSSRTLVFQDPGPLTPSQQFLDDGFPTFFPAPLPAHSSTPSCVGGIMGPNVKPRV